ncbi:flagellar protein FliO/FliZ [Sinobaca qinghaiensis]|uniref:Flagellar protein n=2 Tax=Sinobaca TaxID=342943 RepID=A0A419V5W1_9BACL|nr:flagellar biosynthetic protein FliO [Sinobaca qinghaiensis]RKD75360.1 flagellar protein FliO/FliZ [Sinobaca qinghaiensis]
MIKKICSMWLIALLFFLGMAASVQAEENRTLNDALEEGTPPAEETDAAEEEIALVEERSAVMIFGQMILALAAVITIMYLLLKFINKRTKKYSSNQTMQNLGGVPLGQNKSVQLVKVGERLLVVGVGESIQLLKEIEDEEERETLLEQPEPEPSFFFKKKQKKEDHAGFQFKSILDKRLEEIEKNRKPGSGRDEGS